MCFVVCGEDVICSGYELDAETYVYQDLDDSAEGRSIPFQWKWGIFNLHHHAGAVIEI